MARRTRALSGTPDHHNKEATEQQKRAIKMFDFAERDAKKGKCEEAIDSLSRGFFRRGMSEAHAVEGTGSASTSDLFHKAGDAELRASRAVKRACGFRK